MLISTLEFSISQGKGIEERPDGSTFHDREYNTAALNLYSNVSMFADEKVDDATFPVLQVL